ncbi:unnamed protein product [Sympodiomycopsis kandeliae]
MASERPKRTASSRFRRDDGSATPDEADGGRKKRARTSKSAATNFDMDMDMDQDTEAAAGHQSDDSFDSGSEVDMDDTEDFALSGKKKKQTTSAAKGVKADSSAKASKKSKGNGNAVGTSANKRSKANGKAGKTAAAQQPRRIQRAVVSKEELRIKDDVTLFNAVKNPESALQTTVEEWVVAYQETPGPALTDLINFIIRCCACNGTVDETLVRDLDNVVDSAQEIQEEAKKTPMASYPIVSRSDDYKKFKKSLTEFFSRLFVTAFESDRLLTAPSTAESSEDVFDHPLIDVLKEWLSTFSSSTFRSFRHTATFIVLNNIESLAALLLEKRKTLETTKKHRDAEKKKARPDKARVQQLEEQWQMDKGEERALLETIRDLVDGVFVHRFRDADYTIRTDCTSELGKWIRSYPDVFLKNEYTRFLGVSLTDLAPQVRTAAVRALLPLYSRTAFPEPLRHFTELFKNTLVQMAIFDSETSVRVHIIEILVHIDRRGLLRDGQRQKIGRHIFDQEVRVRNEVAVFLKSLIEDEVAEVADETVGPEPVMVEEAQRDASAREKRAYWEGEVEKLRLKLLAKRLVQFESALNEAQTTEGDADVDTSSAFSAAHAVFLQGEGRTGYAVKALWDFDDTDQPLSGWTELVELLLYDHSDQTTEGEQTVSTSSAKGGRGRGRKGQTGNAAQSSNQPANSAYKLESAEETILLEALVAIAEEVKHRAGQVKPPTSANQEEDPAKVMRDDLTRFLVPKLPQLFAKYRTESVRVSAVLGLLPHLDLELFASVGQGSVLSNLWNEVTTHFTRHSENGLLERGALAIHSLAISAKNHTDLSELTLSKVQSLQETLVNALREPLKGQEVATSALDQDTIFALDVNIQRLSKLFKTTDCCEVMEETENGQVSSGWEIVREIALRAKLGYLGEESMISGCLTVMTTHILWKFSALVGSSPSTSKDERKALADDILVKKNEVLEMMESLITSSDASILHAVKVTAAVRSLQLYLLFHSRQQMDAAAAAAAAQEQGVTEGGEEGSEAGVRSTPAYVPLLPADAPVSISKEVQAGCMNVLLVEINKLIQARQGDDDEEEHENTLADDQRDKQQQDGDDEVQERVVDDDAQDKEEESGEAGKKATPQKRAVTKEDRIPSRETLLKQREVILHVHPIFEAMRLGLVDLSLSAPILAKYRRGGGSLDSLIKSLFEDLREAALMGGDRSMAIDVIFNSLKEAFERYLSQGTAQSSEDFVLLSKSLSSVLVLRGPQLAIVRSIDSRSLLDLHERGCQYITRKWKAADRANAKSIKTRAPLFWKGLVNLLLSAGPTDANRIQAAMRAAIAKEEIEIPPKSKIWEPQLQYEKKLHNIIAKETVPAVNRNVRPGPTPRKGQKEVSEAAEADGDDIGGDQNGSTAHIVESTPLQRPRPRPVGASGGGDGSAADRALNPNNDDDSELSDAESA